MKNLRHPLCMTTFSGIFMLVFRELTVSFPRVCGQTFRGGELGVCQRVGEVGQGGEGEPVKG